ncbi:MAG: toxin-antitoxin system HicB family antitoxin [Acidobacteria bacterium]|nr:toxin-antitoxin system HicB family antitoxin [Acidobacteriota bacterium]
MTQRVSTRGVSTFSLRLPISLKAAVERMAAADGTSMNQFLVMAAAEKLSAIQTAEAYFSELRGHGDREVAIAFLSRAGGEPPRSDDEIL